MLILSEAKVCYEHRIHMDKPDEERNAKRYYTQEELNDVNGMASIMSYPLAMYLECLGNANDGRQIVTPTLAELTVDVGLP